MKSYFIPMVKTQLAKAMGLTHKIEEKRRQKFKRLTGPDWHREPDRFCRETVKIHPKLIGRFYGENNLKKCALEIQRVDGKITLRCAFKTRTRYTWSDKHQTREMNGYCSLWVNHEKIGTKNGVCFTRGADGRFYFSYKNNMEIVMKKI